MATNREGTQLIRDEEVTPYIPKTLIPEGETRGAWTFLGEYGKSQYRSGSIRLLVKVKCKCGHIRWMDRGNFRPARKMGCEECQKQYIWKSQEDRFSHLTPEQMEKKKRMDRLFPK